MDQKRPMLSINQIRILRLFSRGTVNVGNLRKLDQRPLRGLFLKGCFKIGAHLQAEITPWGWELYSLTMKAPEHRKNTDGPLFKAAGEDSVRRMRERKAS